MLDKQIQPDEKLGKILEPEMVSVNEIIRKRMASENAPRIPEVTTHLIGAGGKRLRPMLTLAAARMFNYVGDKHLKLAATVEFIHTATLLHDDVVDESIKRRGRPTANLLWDNKSSRQHQLSSDQDGEVLPSTANCMGDQRKSDRLNPQEDYPLFQCSLRSKFYLKEVW